MTNPLADIDSAEPMSDIVERLLIMGDEIDHEAADEITRLRADLEKWRQASDMFLTSAEAAEADRDKMWEALDEFLGEYDNEVARTPSSHSSITMTFARQNDLISMMRDARQLKERHNE